MRRIFAAVIMAIGAMGSVSFGQGGQHTEGNVDQALRGSGRVNPSTLGMEINIPLGSYPGRGINVPISLSYSSKLWRLNYTHDVQSPPAYGNCRSINEAVYSENSASGWTTSLAVPYIEYSGRDNLFKENGFPFTPELCPNNPPELYNYAYVRRLTVHLPSGATHELRSDDTPQVYSPWSHCPPSGGFPCDPNDARLQNNWNRTFYAVDGSNLKYLEDSTTGTYKLLMPDGSNYEFAGSLIWHNTANVRKALRFTDRNGNFTSYNDSTGVWTDTLGRTLTAPIGSQAPASPTIQNYTMPGMAGQYKFNWKQLKGGSAAESGLTDFNHQLKYRGEYMHETFNGNWATRAPGTYLFNSEIYSAYVLSGANLFNPVVLTEIELPTGQKYKFSYDVFGRINKITYPTGGEEKFVYSVVATLSTVLYNDITRQTNHGVTNRKVYETAGQGTPYEWSYSAHHVAPSGYKVSTTSPDGTLNERFLHRGQDACLYCTHGNFGFDNVLAGMPYEELSYDSSSPRKLLSQKLTAWTSKSFPPHYMGVAGWHPRVTQEESRIYDTLGNGISTTTTFEYEGDLNLRETPVLVKKTTQYAFETVTGFGGLTPDCDGPEGCTNPWCPDYCMSPRCPSCNPTPTPTPNPSPTPTPIPTPLPMPTPPSSPPVKIVETTYVINDTATYPEWVRDIFKARNMVGLVRSSTVKDGSGTTVVSRSETLYDEGYLSPEVGRGNPTTLKVWDSTKGAYTSSSSYISTSARFDQWGNQIEVSDAKGNITTTTFDGTHNAFPVQVTSPIPSDGTHGSNTAFTTTTTFNYTTGLPLTTVDANGLETRIEYDPATLRPLNTKTYYGGNQVGSMAETIYHDEPNNYWVKNRSQIDENKWAESITYFDGLGRAWKSEQVDSGGNIFTEKEFDADGRVSRVTNPFRANETRVWTTNVYDNASRIKEVILPDGAKVKTDYGVASSGSQIGETITITDEAGNQRRSITDALDDVIRVDEPDNSGNLGSISNPTQPTFYTYNALGDMIKVTQGVQNRFFLYDALGRLLRVRQPEQGVNSTLSTTGNPHNNQWSVGFTYDDNENILTSTDPKGVVTTYTYDNLDRIKTRAYSDGTPNVTNKYDNLQNGKGKLIEVSSSVSISRTTAFNNLGAPTSYQQITDGETYSSSYQYNSVGILVSETYPSGRQVNYDFNADGDLSRVWGQTGQSQKTYANSFGYSASGTVEKLKLGNGRWETAQFNNRLQMIQIGLGNSATDTSLWKVNYEFGQLQTNGTVDTNKNNGGIARQTLTVGGMTHPIIHGFKYDALDRLTEAEERSNNQQNWIQQFGYDRYSNRTSLNQWIGQNQLNQTPTVDPSTNRFTTGQGYVYDLNGNLVEDAEGRQFNFNGDNKQTEVRDSQNNVIGTYLYNGEGKRIKKVVPSTGETTIFVYSGDKLIAEYSTQLSQTPTTSYLTSDHLSTPRVITDAFGQVISRRDFMPFGEELFNGIGERSTALKYGVADIIRQKFTGYQKDQETGLDFAEARMYESRHGRFTAVDPLLASGQSANPQTFNRYAYVMNSPTTLTDPSGLLPKSAAPGDNCNFRCRVTNAINGEGELSEADRDLANFHIQNGTALGYTFLNAAEAEIRRQSQQPAENTENSTTESSSSGQTLRPQPRRGRGRNARRGATWREGTGKPKPGAGRRPDPSKDPGREGGPIFSGLKDHARRHGMGMLAAMYHRHAQQHMQRHHWRGQIRHDGINRVYYVSLTQTRAAGTNDVIYWMTSTSTNGRRIYTHFQTSYRDLQKVGITLPENMRPVGANFIGPIVEPAPIN